MKIIKPGKRPELQTWAGDCKICGAEVEATRPELRIEYDQRENGEFGRAPCPCCGREMIFYPR